MADRAGCRDAREQLGESCRRESSGLIAEREELWLAAPACRDRSRVAGDCRHRRELEWRSARPQWTGVVVMSSRSQPARSAVTAQDRLSSDGVGSPVLRQCAGRDLLAVNQDVGRGFDADADLVAVDLDHSDNDIVTNDDFLAQLPAQNQHGHLPVDIEDLELSFPVRHQTAPFHIMHLLCLFCQREDISCWKIILDKIWIDQTLISRSILNKRCHSSLFLRHRL